MKLEEKYELLVTRVRRWADLEVPAQQLAEVAEQGPAEAESDFAAGQASADAYNALECRDLLKQIGELLDEGHH